jgi:hypothetical protein
VEVGKGAGATPVGVADGGGIVGSEGVVAVGVLPCGDGVGLAGAEAEAVVDSG